MWRQRDRNIMALVVTLLRETNLWLRTMAGEVTNLRKEIEELKRRDNGSGIPPNHTLHGSPADAG